MYLYLHARSRTCVCLHSYNWKMASFKNQNELITGENALNFYWEHTIPFVFSACVASQKVCSRNSYLVVEQLIEHLSCCVCANKMFKPWWQSSWFEPYIDCQRVCNLTVCNWFHSFFVFNIEQFKCKCMTYTIPFDIFINVKLKLGSEEKKFK